MYTLIFIPVLYLLFYSSFFSFVEISVKDILLLLAFNILLIIIRIFLQRTRKEKLINKTTDLRNKIDVYNLQYEELLESYLNKYGTMEKIKGYTTKAASFTGSIMRQTGSVGVNYKPYAHYMGALYFAGEGISWLSNKIGNFFKSEEQKRLEEKILNYEIVLKTLIPRYNKKIKQLNNQNMYLVSFIIFVILLSVGFAVLSNMEMISSILNFID